jgi:hypothetical protein
MSLHAQLQKLGLTPTQTSDILSKYISSPKGRAALAAAMINPLRTRREYRGIQICNQCAQVISDPAYPTGKRYSNQEDHFHSLDEIRVWQIMSA